MLTPECAGWWWWWTLVVWLEGGLSQLRLIIQGTEPGKFDEVRVLVCANPCVHAPFSATHPYERAKQHVKEHSQALPHPQPTHLTNNCRLCRLSGGTLPKERTGY